MSSFAGQRFASVRAVTTASLFLLTPFAAQAADVNITNSRTTPIETATADGASAGNVEVSSGGSVTTTTGPSVTLNSDNTFVNLGTVEVTSGTNAVAVKIEGGYTGSFSSEGVIDAVEIDDEDVAIGSGNIGVWITGAGVFTGDISFQEDSNTGAGGTNAVTLAIEAGVVGDIYVDGYMTALGTNATTINMLAPVDGNVTLDANGTIYAGGEGARGVFVDAPLSGTLSIGGAVTVTGIQANVDYDPDDDGTYVYPMAEFGIGIASSLGNGLQAATDATFATTYAYTGIFISPALATTPSDITLGVIDAGSTPYGFYNDGSITAGYGPEGTDITTLRIEGSSTGGIFHTFIEGGIYNDGSIQAISTTGGTTTAISLGDYAGTPMLTSTSSIGSSSSGGETATAYGIVIESGASLPAFTNSGSLTAAATADDAYAYALVDLSGTLLSVTNSGTMTATANVTADVDNPGDDDVDGDVGDGASVVIVLDLSHASGATTVANSGTVTGDTKLSDQNDTLTIGDDGDGSDETQSSWTGAIAFAGGDDSFTLSGDGIFTGSVTKTGGSLAIDVQDATLALGREDYITATTIDFGAGSSLTLEITPGNSATPRLAASDRITFADGAQVTATMVEFGGVDLVSILARAPLIDASALSSDLVAQDIPFMYTGETTLVDGAVEDELVLTLHLKTAAELNLNANQTAFYDSVLDILGVTDNYLAEPLLAVSDADEFKRAYDALMPSTSQPTLRGAVALYDATERAHDQRTAALLTGDTSIGGFNGWWSGSMMSTTVDGTDAGAGINGDVIQASYGAEGLFAPFGLIGASFSHGSATMTEDGTDDRVKIDSAHGAVYAAVAAGPFFAQGSVGIGTLLNRSTRTFETTAHILEIEERWDANTMDASVQGGLNARLGKIIFRPWAGVSWLNVVEEPHNDDEDLTGFDLAYDELDIDVKRAKAGLSILFAGGDRHGHVQPELRASYSRLLSENATTLSGMFEGGAVPFVLDTIPLTEEEISAGMGLLIVIEGVSFGLNYDATLGDGELSHGGKLNVGVQF